LLADTTEEKLRLHWRGGGLKRLQGLGGPSGKASRSAAQLSGALKRKIAAISVWIKKIWGGSAPGERKYITAGHISAK